MNVLRGVVLALVLLMAGHLWLAGAFTRQVDSPQPTQVPWQYR